MLKYLNFATKICFRLGESCFPADSIKYLTVKSSHISNFCYHKFHSIKAIPLKIHIVFVLPHSDFLPSSWNCLN